MDVLVIGSGSHGTAFAEEFAHHDVFDEVIVGTNRHPLEASDNRIRYTDDWRDFQPDIVVLAESRVPRELRREMASKKRPIEEFWEIESECNTNLVNECFDWLSEAKWKILVVATNPPQEWANILKFYLPNRQIYGFGSVFDSARIKAYCIAMMPALSRLTTSDFRVIGEHGAARNFYEAVVPDDVFDTARWMSNAASVAFINAPTEIAKTWWKLVGIRPLVSGLSGRRTQTHLIAPFHVNGACALIGVDVSIRNLDVKVDNILMDQNVNVASLHNYVMQVQEKTQQDSQVMCKIK